MLVLGLVVPLGFGPKRLPEMGRSLGRGMREFKNSISGDKDDTLDALTDDPLGPQPIPVTDATGTRAHAQTVVDEREAA